MRVLAGTSGYSYKEWCGPFYPEGLAPAGMLGAYAARLPTVEINNTFYRMPKAAVVAGWAEQVPADFRFVIKASQRITHRQRLKDASDSVAYLFKVIAILEQRLGAVLFQLPPFLKKDVPLLEDFLAVLPPDFRPAFEFRHPSWFDDRVYAALSRAGAALCGGDLDAETKSPPLVATADWGYLRLRREDSVYSEAELKAWALRISEQKWKEAFVFFKHELAGPLLAEQLNALARSGDTGEGARATEPPVQAAATTESRGPEQQPGPQPRPQSEARPQREARPQQSLGPQEPEPQQPQLSGGPAVAAAPKARVRKAGGAPRQSPGKVSGSG